MATKNKKPAITEKPVWFITGCSTGFGRELATYVLERGYRTVVTARKPDEVKDLAVTGGRTMINEADELDDADTADLFTEIPRGIDK